MLAAFSFQKRYVINIDFLNSFKTRLNAFWG
nr:MAG TPA: hypothetical protein [Caudoviricetes sp.]